MRLPDEPDSYGEINIVPMIDIIFSILAFFIISSLSLTRSEGLSVDLPSAKTASVKQTEQINITIKPDGNLFLNRQPIALEGLQPSLTQMIPSGNESLVIVNADEKVDHGSVVQVMDQVRQVKGAKLAIAAKKINQN
ncbi:MAG: biopolymer transporter ExbD [Snowella sp.]|nr:biopolymer transporter ExbD [Snowella sp.]